ncbi:MAG TPA: lytic transglycosylase F [Desulfobulbus sp.]|nr:lytic transglycosylase F [Desulfobulbus sp.]
MTMMARYLSTYRVFCRGLCCLLLFLMWPTAALPATGREITADVRREWTGDFDQMVRMHRIRVLVPFSKTFYFLDRGRQLGFTYEMVRRFETFINKRLKKGHVKVKVVIIPTQRNRLLPDLVAGRGDIAAGNLTITPERLKKVDFSDPFFTDVSEIIVTGPGGPQLHSVLDLAGREVYVRRSSSYYDSLLRLNRVLREKGKKPVVIRLADEYLEDEDLLEMVNAGLLPMIVIDSHKGMFWRQIFKSITLHPDIKVRSGGRLGWAVRRNSPRLLAEINAFVRKNRKGTLHFNILFKRYLKDTRYVRAALSEKEIRKFDQTLELFRRYGAKYDFNWIMLAALAYQESGLDQNKRSRAGAIGVMQILPSTAADPNVGIRNIERIDNNIHAGTKYLRFMMDRYFNDPGMDRLNRGLFAFAAYNAGPARIAKLRRQAARQGLNPNVWFNNVELVAARRIGRETVQYVANIYKYYVAYRMIVSRNNRATVGKSLLEEQLRKKGAR